MRFLEPEIYRSGEWRESEHCWICEKWKRILIDSRKVDKIESNPGMSSALASPNPGGSPGLMKMSMRQVPMYTNTYIYGSFTNWRPRPLLMSDDLGVLAYCDYIPSGNHFYILSNRPAVLLTVKVFEMMEKLFLKPREDEPPVIILPPKTKRKMRKKFIKELSVFKDFVEDDDSLLRKMIEADFRNNKMAKVAHSKEEMNEIKEYMLANHYKYLKNSFLNYQSLFLDDYPAISQLDFGHIARDAKLLDQKLRISDVDTVFFASQNDSKADKDKEKAFNPERKLIRSEFVEAIVRLSQAKFRELVGTVPTPEIYSKVTLNLPNAV
jgi:hypothetical protein